MDGTYRDIAELEAMEENMVSCAVAARALGMSDQALRTAARQRPDLLLVRPHIYGSRVTFARNELIGAIKAANLQRVTDKELFAELLRRAPAGLLQQELTRRAAEEGGKAR